MKKYDFCPNCSIGLNSREMALGFCQNCKHNWDEEYKMRKARKEPKPRACLTCNADITDRHPRAKYCEKCARERIYEKNRAWKLREYHQKKELKERRCIDCQADISHRGGKAIRCEKCAPIAAYIQTKIAEKKRRAERRQHRPGAPIRAITSLGSELGELSGGCSKERKQRPQLPPPNLAKAQYIVKIGKTTYFPRTEKRYKELLAEKLEKER